MSEPHAAIALSQFGRLDEFIAHRQHVAHRYDAAMISLPLVPLAIAETSRCNYYKYVAFLPDGIDRAELKRVLREEHGVGLSGEVYDTPLHRQPVFEQWADGALPGAEWLCERHICLPISAVMTDDDADYVIEALADALARA
jgi:dTDP-4-amino-4,6-dideoxygalactose transaminase